LGIGDWGLGIGDWVLVQSPTPNPQSPIPNPQSPTMLSIVYLIKFINNKNNYFKLINYNN